MARNNEEKQVNSQNNETPAPEIQPQKNPDAPKRTQGMMEKIASVGRAALKIGGALLGGIIGFLIFGPLSLIISVPLLLSTTGQATSQASDEFRETNRKYTYLNMQQRMQDEATQNTFYNNNQQFSNQKTSSQALPVRSQSAVTDSETVINSLLNQINNMNTRLASLTSKLDSQSNSTKNDSLINDNKASSIQRMNVNEIKRSVKPEARNLNVNINRSSNQQKQPNEQRATVTRTRRSN